MQQSGSAKRTNGSGRIAVAGAQISSTPSVSREVFLSHQQVSHYAQMADTHYCYGALLTVV